MPKNTEAMLRLELTGVPTPVQKVTFLVLTLTFKTMHKKNYRVLKLFLLLLFFNVGCKKFITKEITGDYPETQFYKTPAQAILAINAAYQTLTFTNANNNRLWVFGDVASDDAAKGGDPGDQADIDLIDQFNITPINGNLEAMWGLLYEGVTRCNIVLKKIP